MSFRNPKVGIKIYRTPKLSSTSYSNKVINSVSDALNLNLLSFSYDNETGVVQVLNSPDYLIWEFNISNLGKLTVEDLNGNSVELRFSYEESSGHVLMDTIGI